MKNLNIGKDKSEIIEIEDVIPTPPHYGAERAAEYPTIQEQLDMLYWDSINGTSKWVDLIKSIKEKHPKS
jgi:hypothetical protein